MQELGITHECVYATRQNNQAPSNFKEKHAMGKAPILLLEDGKTTITESGAICDFIVEAYADEKQKTQFYNGGSPVQAAEVRSWMYFAEGTLLLHALVRTESPSLI